MASKSSEQMNETVNDASNEALPEVIFVRRDYDGDSGYLCSFEDSDEAVEDDGDVTEIGVYKLIRVARMKKVVQEL